MDTFEYDNGFGFSEHFKMNWTPDEKNWTDSDEDFYRRNSLLFFRAFFAEHLAQISTAFVLGETSIEYLRIIMDDKEVHFSGTEYDKKTIEAIRELRDTEAEFRNIEVFLKCEGNNFEGKAVPFSPIAYLNDIEDEKFFDYVSYCMTAYDCNGILPSFRYGYQNDVLYHGRLEEKKILPEEIPDGYEWEYYCFESPVLVYDYDKPDVERVETICKEICELNDLKDPVKMQKDNEVFECDINSVKIMNREKLVRFMELVNELNAVFNQYSDVDAYAGFMMHECSGKCEPYTLMIKYEEGVPSLFLNGFGNCN